MVKPLPPEDLRHVLAHTTGLWEELRGRSIFITGGTGFFGHWLVESFLAANRELQLQARLTLLTRDPEAFAKKSPHIVSDTSVTLSQGDVRDFPFPEGDFTHVIHAATAASAKIDTESPELMRETIVEGTRHVLDFASSHGVRKLLFTSSGAVYGKQPADLSHLPEDYAVAPHFPPAVTAYGEGKQRAENLCHDYRKKSSLEIKIARCFAFVGPHLPLQAHFAIGNFIYDAMEGRAIQVRDGTPYRSYLYAADLAIWLWTILFVGQPLRPYNTGSSEAVSIEELARNIAQSLSSPSQKLSPVTGSGQPPLRYVPSVERARLELGLRARIPLVAAIQKTATWHQMV